MIERPDGTLALKTSSDPAVTRALGYRRYWLGVDLGQSDPSALILMVDERIPRWEGSVQILGERKRAIVWADALRDTAYTVIAKYLIDTMAKPAIRGRVLLSLDGTGIGAAFSDFSFDLGLDHIAVTITGGSEPNRHGMKHNVPKSKLIGDLANALETGKLTIAKDLNLKEQLAKDLQAFEIKVTAAGNSVLDARRVDGSHADLAIAAALAFYHSDNASITWVGDIDGYW